MANTVEGFFYCLSVAYDRGKAMKKRKISIAIIIFFIPFVSAVLAFASQPIKNKELSHNTKKRNPAFALSTDAVLHKIKEKQPITLVDIRGKDQFKTVSIPGAINIPLYAIKTKIYLKSQPLILINEGYHYEPLERECAQLRKAGFQAWILHGGLTGWKQTGGPLNGDFEFPTRPYIIAVS